MKELWDLIDHYTSMGCKVSFQRELTQNKITMEDDDGRTLGDKEARAEIARLQSLGHKLMPCGNCEGFDPFGKGCPGHPVM